MGGNGNNGKKQLFLSDIENLGKSTSVLPTIPEESPESVQRAEAEATQKDTPELKVPTKTTARKKLSIGFSGRMSQMLTKTLTVVGGGVTSLINFFSPITKDSEATKSAASKSATVANSSAALSVTGPKTNVKVKGRKSVAIPHGNKHFADLKSNFKAGFTPNPKATFLNITQDNLNQIIVLHTDAFDNLSLKEMFKNFNSNNEKLTFANELNALLQSYKKIISNTEFEHQDSQVKADAEALVARQLVLLNALEKTPKPYHQEDYVPLGIYFNKLTEALADVTKKEYTDILNKFLTAPNKLTAKDAAGEIKIETKPIVPTQPHSPASKKVPTSPMEDPAENTVYTVVAEPAVDTVEDPLVEDSTPGQAMKRIMKNSAKSAITSKEREATSVATINTANYGDFANTVTADQLFNNLTEKISVVSAKSLKNSNPNYTTEQQQLHDQNKVDVYKDKLGAEKFSMSKSSANVLSAKFAGSNVVALTVKVDTNPSNHIQKATLTVSGEHNNRHDIQAYTTDYLRKEAKLLGAKSVMISSVNADGSVNVENILKGAFNALNSDLIPRFDSVTWAKISNYYNEAPAYVKQGPDETIDTYTLRCKSKQFVEFLLRNVEPTKATTKTFAQVRLAFTELADKLDYETVYTNKRRNT